MTVAIYNAAGDIVMFMDADLEQIMLNVPEGGRYEEVPWQRLAELRRIDGREAKP
jgi:hypothetical protein